MKKFRELVKETRVEDEGFESEAARTLKEKPNKESMPKLKEAIKDKFDIGEYDQEGDMAKSDLRSILANAKRVHDMLEDSDNLPEWVQSKITKAEDYMSTVANYMEAEMNEEVELDEGAKETQKRASELADKLRKKDPEKSKMYRNLAIKASQRSFNPTGVSKGKGPIGQGNKAQRRLGKEPVPSPMSSDRMRDYSEEVELEEGVGGSIVGAVGQFIGNKIDPLHGEIMRAHGEMAGRAAEYTIRKHLNKLHKALKTHLSTGNPQMQTEESMPASKSLQKRHDDERKKRGLPDPSYYLELMKKKKKEIEDMKKEEVEQIDEKNVPTSPEKWAQAKAQAKAKFDVYPSAYANGWAAKKYKEMGGGWKSVSEETELEEGYYKSQEIERQETERLAKPPFSPDKPKKPSVVVGKKPEGYSRARQLARQAMKKYVKEEDTEKFYTSSRKAQIVKNAAKKTSPEDKFQDKPIISSTATRNT